MRKVLLVAGNFPPVRASGCVRLGGLAKFLPEFGWEPIVITRALEGRLSGSCRIVETPWYDVLQPLRWVVRSGRGEEGGEAATPSATFSQDGGWRRQAALAANALLAFPDPKVGWYPYAVREALALMRRERVDAVISSFSPATAHLIGRRVRQRARIPWIADFRDLWTQSHYYPFGPLRRRAERWLEEWALRDATMLVTMSHLWAEQLAELHPGREVRCIPNGFDPLEFEGPPPSSGPGALRLVYAGLLYEGRRDPAPLFAAMASLIRAGRVPRTELRFDVYSAREPWLTEMIERFGLGGVVTIRDWVPRSEALRQICQADLLLQLTWNNPGEEGSTPAKLFEYLGAGRPILATGFPRGVARRILEETRSGLFAESVDEIADILYKAYLEKLATGRVASHQDRQAALKYSHKEMARKFAAALTDVTDRV